MNTFLYALVAGSWTVLGISFGFAQYTGVPVSVPPDLDPIRAAIEAGELEKARTELDYFSVVLPQEPAVPFLRGLCVLNQLYALNPSQHRLPTVSDHLPSANNHNMLVIQAILDEDKLESTEIINELAELESLYDKELLPESKVPSKWPTETAEQVVPLFEQTLQLDPEHKPAYDNALFVLARTGDVEGLKRVFQKYSGSFSNQDRVITGLAVRKILADDHYQRALALNWSMFLAEQFPAEPSVLTAAAHHHRERGNLQSALSLFEKALALDPTHEGVGLSLYELYLLTGNTPKADAVLRTLATDRSNEQAQFANLCQKLLRGEPGAREKAFEWLAQPTDGRPPHSLAFIQALVATPTLTYATYAQARATCPTATHELPLNLWAVQYFPDSLEPVLALANTYTALGHYAGSEKILTTLEHRVANTSHQRLHTEYAKVKAWNLERLAQIQHADTYWRKLLTESDEYYQTAACYFVAKHLVQQSKTDEATHYLQLGAQAQLFTKYSYLCMALLEAIEID
jgi:tetratricopeptide (TPR) repeat protein